MQIPSGLSYRQSETGWQSSRYSSFSSIVDQVIAHRMANSWLITKNGASVDRAIVEMEVDNFNTAFCRAMGGDWLQYIDGGPPPPVPFQPPPPLPAFQSGLSRGVAAIKKLASGAAVLFDWQESGQPPVAAELSAKRAAVCATCPKNSHDEVGEWFTGPIADGIRKKLAALYDLKLTTPYDASLGVCSACLCPMKLKVWTPMNLVQARTTAEVRSELVPNCWINAEWV